MDNIGFDKLYRKVSPKQKEELLLFRKNHPIHNLMVKETNWKYLVSGQHERVLLFLTGFLGQGENGFKLVTRLNDNYKVIAPNYPFLT